jgi:hypothetical protein
MFKFIIIVVVGFFVIRLVYRGLSQASPKTVAPMELKACAYCGTLMRVDKACVADARTFCSLEHANQFHNRPPQ